MRAAVKLAAAGALAFGAFRAARAFTADSPEPEPVQDDPQPDPAPADSILTAITSTAADLFESLGNMMNKWRVPEIYRGAIAGAERSNGLPPNLLARLLWAESRYRPDIIDGRVRSSVGALGIAQFMPGTAAEMGIDPLDPFAAIDAAARYLRRLYGMFGNWREAVAAYNWGPGNVRTKGIGAAPAETRSYVSGILSDVGLV